MTRVPWQTFPDPAGDPFITYVAMDDGPIYRLDEAALIELDEQNLRNWKISGADDDPGPWTPR